VNLPIPPRPDSGAGVPQPERLTTDGRPRSTWGWFEGVGVYLIAFLAAGFAQIPILALLGETMVNGAIGQTEIFATIVGDVVMGGVLVFWLQRWHPEWRAAMVLPPAQDRIWRDLLFGAIGGLILVPAVSLISVVVAASFREAVGHDVTVPDQVAPGLSLLANSFLVVLAVVIAPISEELFFRGVLFRTVRDRHGFWAAALASALPFDWCTTCPLRRRCAGPAVTMVFWAWAWRGYERRGTVVASTAAHMVFNIVGRDHHRYRSIAPRRVRMLCPTA
jgi:membrane protease YdiL (CAAX protease family)